MARLRRRRARGRRFAEGGFSLGSGAVTDQAVSWRGARAKEGGGTSPEELIAAALSKLRPDGACRRLRQAGTLRVRGSRRPRCQGEEEFKMTKIELASACERDRRRGVPAGRARHKDVSRHSKGNVRPRRSLCRSRARSARPRSRRTRRPWSGSRLPRGPRRLFGAGAGSKSPSHVAQAARTSPSSGIPIVIDQVGAARPRTPVIHAPEDQRFGRFPGQHGRRRP